MKSYELTFLAFPELSSEQLINLQEKIVLFIQEEKGILRKINKPIKRDLAYPIKNKWQAYLMSLNFQLNPENLKNIEKKLKEEEEILRYLILAKPIKKITRGRLTRITVGTKKPSLKIPKSKVEFKEIEKKLEEILKE